MSKQGNVVVRDNAGANTGIRRRIHFIDGANVTITTADSGPNDEVTITIASVGGVGADQDILYEAPNPDDNKSRYATMLMPDGVSTLIRQTFYLPTNWSGSWSTDIIVIPDGTGNLRWGVDTDFGQVCAGEQYNAHTDTIALGQTAVTNGEIECLDISTALTNAAALDLVGIEFTRDGGDALDTVNADMHYVGILLRAP